MKKLFFTLIVLIFQCIPFSNVFAVYESCSCQFTLSVYDVIEGEYCKKNEFTTSFPFASTRATIGEELGLLAITVNSNCSNGVVEPYQANPFENDEFVLNANEGCDGTSVSLDSEAVINDVGGVSHAATQYTVSCTAIETASTGSSQDTPTGVSVGGQDAPAVIETPLINPLTGTTNAQEIPELVGGIIQRILGILGSLALVVFMYGAFKWITSEGEAENITAGTHTMAYAAIGILVIFASYGILSSVIGGILGQ
jgi:hypothetical protein